MNVRSRYNARHSKRKQNIILNSLIGIVVAVILVLMANIFFSGDGSEPTAGEETNSAVNESTKSASDKENTEDAITSDEADTSESEENNSSDEAANKDTEKDEKNDDQEDEEKTDEQDGSEDHASGEVNLEGPWEPVGTTQSGNHVSDYTKGSVDWNEKLEAVETVVGYPKEEMVVHWLGGNGGPQKSVATVSQKGGNDTQYVIELEWVEGKGWKAVSAKEK